jgi:cytochrome c biogenesis protein ResB
MAMTGLLTALCVYGAFIGTQNAAKLFSSPPLIVFWIAAAVLLIFTPRARSNTWAMMIRIGAILLIAGGMWGSRNAHFLREKYLAIDKVHKAAMIISAGDSVNEVITPENEIGEIPFSIRLKDFKIIYTDNGGRIKDYISEVEVVRDDKVVKTFEIEVNKPLHYGGYYFYQSSYDREQGEYTVLMVRSDSGTMISYAGFYLLGLGVFGSLWLREIFGVGEVENGN